MSAARIATIVLALPHSREELEKIVFGLIENTPDDAYDVVLVGTGAPNDVVELAKTFEGDVRVLDGTVSLDEAVRQVARSDTPPRLIAIAGGSNPGFLPYWLEDAVASSLPINVVSPSQFVVIRSDQVDTTPDIADFFRPMSPPPAVQSDLGPQFMSDVAQLQGLLQEGKAGVGDIPVDIAERLRERMHMEEERRRLLIARRGRDVCWTDEDEDEPLVTIRIPTYNRGQRCLDTAIRAALSQTYERIEVLLIGDGCDEEVASVYRTVKDDRFQFINLAERGVYPSDPWLRWLVAGAPPCNVAVTLAQGSWIAPCDDDDEFTPDHVEVLLREARRRRLEMVWSKSEMETPEGWEVIGKEPLGPGAGTHGSIFYSAGLRFLQWSDTSWKMNEPADGNFLRRLTAIGVRTGFVDHVTYRHYLEGRYRLNISGPQSMS